MNTVTYTKGGGTRTFDRQYILDRTVVDQSKCWIWTGPSAAGRARICWNRGQVYAYRASYELFVGPIPAGQQVNHHCDNPMCVNPTHVYAGTQTENTQDARDRGRSTPPPSRHGDEHPAAVPTDVVRAAVREYLAGGSTQAQVARRHGVSQSALGRWVRGASRSDAGTVTRRVGKGRVDLSRGGPQPCGTRSAYVRHIRSGETTCGPCRAANTAYLQAYKAARHTTDQRNR